MNFYSATVDVKPKETFTIRPKMDAFVILV